MSVCRSLTQSLFSIVLPKTYAPVLPPTLRTFCCNSLAHSPKGVKKVLDNNFDAPKVKILKQKIELLGISFDNSYFPGEFGNLFCPKCRGGRLKERSLSFHIISNGEFAMWRCFRPTCGWAGQVFADDRELESRACVNAMPFGQMDEKSLGLEPLGSEVVDYFEERLISEKTSSGNAVWLLSDEEIYYMETDNEAVGDDVVEIITTKKAIWPQNVESEFITLLEEEVKKGNRQTTTLTRAAWKHIKEELKNKFGKEYTMEQFKNKYNQLRGKWKDFSNLIKVETGLGYNSATGQIIASDDEWKKLCEKYKSAKRFRKKGCIHYDKLCTIFGDTTASGVNQHPSTKSPSISNDETEGENDFEQEENSYQTKRKSRENIQIGSSSVTTGEVDGQENELNMKLMNCLGILDKLEGIDVASFTKAVKILKEDPLWMDVFLALSDDRKKDFVLNL